MKKFFVFLVICMIFLIQTNCEKFKNPVKDDVSTEQKMKEQVKPEKPGKPVDDKFPPTIDEVIVLNQDDQPNLNASPVLLPYGPAKIHYTVSDNIGITNVKISIRRDDDNDNFFKILFYKNIKIIEKIYDGSQTTITDEILWDGSVDYTSLFSTDGFIFDEFSTPNPDVYLISFEVYDGTSHTKNWISTEELLKIKVADNYKIFVSPENTKSEFHIEELSPNKNDPKTKKSKFSAELSATVICNEGGFRVNGQWVQVHPDGEGGLSNYSGCPNCGLYDDDGDGEATSSPILVGSGTYRFYVRLLYHPDFSYDPSWNVPVETFVEVTVP